MAEGIENHIIDYKATILHFMLVIGEQDSVPLRPHKELFERLKNVPALNESANKCLDLILGRK